MKPAIGSSSVEHAMSDALASDAAVARTRSAASRGIATARHGSSAPAANESSTARIGTVAQNEPCLADDDAADAQDPLGD